MAPGQVIAVDEFDAIYREAVKPGEKSGTGAPVPAPNDPSWGMTRHLTAPLVFRYSAITWNAHRIHYDADYTRQEEGYPGTVQNGGLTMQLLLDAAVAHTPGTLRGFSARLTRPIYVGDTISWRPCAEGWARCWPGCRTRTATSAPSSIASSLMRPIAQRRRREA